MAKEKPTYDNGEYCVEHMENGTWRKRKTGKHLSRNWNHITIGYAKTQFEERTRIGHYVRIIHEPTSKTVATNYLLLVAPEHQMWLRRMKDYIDAISS